MIRAVLLWIVLALPVGAQSLPDWKYTSINDFAGLLSNDDTRILDQALIALNAETGIEGTIVTLNDRASYGGNAGLEAFATQLFNYWGVGDKRKNDGFMVMILRDDREARIELGAGYPRAFDLYAQKIMDDIMLPEFRSGDYSTGLREGTLAVIDRIARPHAADQPEPAIPLAAQSDSSWGSKNPLSLMAMIVAVIAALPLSVVGFVMWTRNRCPQCKNRGLVEIAEPIRTPAADNGWKVSQNTVKRLCQNCGWSTTLTRDLPYTDTFAADGVFLGRERDYSSSSSSSDRSGGSSGFGGGSSSGGGASGRW